MTRKVYFTERSLIGTARIQALINGDQNAVLLSETLFHPQGGGQKADLGYISEARVHHVAKREDGEVLHLVESIEGLQIGQEVDIAVDAGPRLLHSRLHTAGHLIAALAESLASGVKAKAGHHWPNEARVDFEIENGGVGPEFEEHLNAALAEAIARDIGVETSSDDPPPRQVRIGAYAPVPCGGTHVASLRDLELVTVRKIKAAKGTLRISYDVSLVPIAEYDPARY